MADGVSNRILILLVMTMVAMVLLMFTIVIHVTFCSRTHISYGADSRRGGRLRALGRRRLAVKKG